MVTSEIRIHTDHLLQRIETLKAFLVQFPDKAGIVERLFFQEGQFRSGLLRIDQVPATGSGHLGLRFDFSDEGLELMRAIVAGEIE